MENDKKKKNCWEVMKCGRELGGENADELGICPVAKADDHDGINDGKCGGRICWYIAGSLCGGQVQGTFVKKFLNCLKCPFYLQVSEEEGRFFISIPDDEKECDSE